jgi:flagellar motor switch protein FliG
MDINKRRSDAYKRASAARRSRPEDVSKANSEARTERGSEEPQQPERPAASSVARPTAGSGGDRRTASGRVGKLLMLLGREDAARVLEHLSEEEVEAVARQIAATDQLGPDDGAEILAEFGFQMESRPAVGGRAAARSILTRAFGEEEAETILLRALGEKRRHFAFLEELEAAHVRALVKDESTAVVALVLGHMSPTDAAEVLKLLPGDVRVSVLRRMARSQEVDIEVVRRVEESLRAKIERIATAQSEELDGRSTLAEILRHMDHAHEESLLEALEERDAELVADIEDRLFTIDTLLLIDDRQLADVLRAYSDHDLALVLKGKDEEIRAKVLRNLSDRRRGIVAEEYRFLGPVPKREVAEATGALLSDLRKLEADGRLVVRREGDQYI